MKQIIKEYSSISAFEDYINNTPLNNIFRWAPLASSTSGEAFTGTKTYEEAVDLLKHGWDEGSKKIEQQLKLIAKDVGHVKTKTTTYDVTGFQASVPRYLQGIPTNMINHKEVIRKQKVITLVKNINYMANTSKDEIIAESTKAIQVIKKIEAMGYRVNLDIISVSVVGEKILGKFEIEELHSIRVRLKSANERTNVSKMAFALVHPSMLRRFEFRHLEVCQELTSQKWNPSYGKVADLNTTLSILKKTDYYIPNFIPDIDSFIKSLNLQ